MLVPFILHLAEHGRMKRSVLVHPVGTSAPRQETVTRLPLSCQFTVGICDVIPTSQHTVINLLSDHQPLMPNAVRHMHHVLVCLICHTPQTFDPKLNTKK